MSHFSLKSLTFYGVAITSVVVLFKLVTAYGETNLKAQPDIGGFYPLEIENSPECLQSNPLVLAIQQSGIYLNGVFLKDQNNISQEALGEEQPSLFGRWENQQLNLSGSLPGFNTCANNSVSIDAAFQENTLNGQIILDPTAGALNFNARREALKQPSKSEH